MSDRVGRPRQEERLCDWICCAAQRSTNFGFVAESSFGDHRIESAPTSHLRE